MPRRRDFLCLEMIRDIANKGPVHVPDYLSGSMTGCRALNNGMV